MKVNEWQGKGCRHSKAYPTIYLNTAGYLWCPDCGATRQIIVLKNNVSTCTEKKWLYPRGYSNVLKQLDRIETDKENR